MHCICGHTKFDRFDRAFYEVTEAGVTQKAPNLLGFVECLKCGIVRQEKLPYETNEEQIEFYANYQPVTEAYKAKTY